MRHIFVAIRISPDLLAETLAWRGAHLDLPVRWIKEGNLHITLIPPWDAETDEVADVLQRVKQAGEGFSAFGVHFTSIISGPTLEENNLLMAIGEAPDQIVTLKGALEEVLGRKGDPRPFLLHLTLARIKPDDIHGFLREPFIQPIAWKEKIKGFELMESVILPEGADYRTVEKIEFKY